MSVADDGAGVAPQGVPAVGEAIITHKIGLHARPAVKLTKLAKQYDSAIRLRAGEDGAWTDAKSIVKVMALKVKAGQRLRFEARGEDAGEAVDALVALVLRNFDEPQG